MNEIIQLPQTNKFLGSCPGCGKPMWEDDYFKVGKFGKLYRCIACKTVMLLENIIPF